MKKFLTLTIIAIIALIGLSVSVNAAEVSTSSDLAKYLEETDETVITLKDKITLTETITISNEKSNKTLDLNGKTLTLGSNSIIVESGVLTVKNGTILADKDAFQVLSAGSAILNIEKDVNVTAGYNAVYIRYPGAVLNTEGKLTSTGSYATIQGNGSDSSGGVIVNIKGGTITSNAEGVYFPNTAELNISGGLITGTTAVYHKAGKLKISGGELIATGAEAEYVHNNNGCDATGDALVIEASGYPGGVPVVSITGGTFTSENNKAIGYYQQAENYKLADEKFITGGAFSSDVSDYVSTGYVINKVYTYEVDMYEVKLNRPIVMPDTLTEDSGEIEMKVGTDLQEELERIFEEEIDKNKTLREALEKGQKVRIDVQLERLEEAKIKAQEIKALKEAAKEGKFVKFYDITLAMIADGTEDLGTISEISNKITFSVLIPEELVKEGRTFFMYRYHEEENGPEVEKITGEVNEENYFVFESNKFSTYALAYEDKVDEPTAEKDETPKTGSVDVVLFASAIVAIISVAGIVTVKKYTR